MHSLECSKVIECLPFECEQIEIEDEVKSKMVTLVERQVLYKTLR